MPDLPELIAPLRKYLKKGARFEDYWEDAAAQAARKRLITAVLKNCTIVTPDYEAAAKPFESGRPFEYFTDASDYGWRMVLTQRQTRSGTPQIVAVVVRSFTTTQLKWSTFEI